MKGFVNPRLVTVARESRGMTQAQLANAIEISQGKLSKYENGMLPVTDEDLKSLSDALAYTTEFFTQGDELLGPSSVCIHHRKRASMPASQLKVIHAELNIFRLQLARLLAGIKVDSIPAFHPMDVDEYGGPEHVAREARRMWRIPLGPIADLFGIAEKAGGIVRRVNFGTKLIDAVSQIISGAPPIFFVSADTPADRLRFSMAHEMGHALMHQCLPSPDIEAEADRFASELLMPGAEIGPSLRGLSLDKLPSLKGHWKVSMAALVKRAADLERISERHYQTLFMQISKSGWRLNCTFRKLHSVN